MSLEIPLDASLRNEFCFKMLGVREDFHSHREPEGSLRRVCAGGNKYTGQFTPSELQAKDRAQSQQANLSAQKKSTPYRSLLEQADYYDWEWSQSHQEYDESY